MHLSNSLRMQSRETVAFVGAGGKTSAMFRVADELVARGQHVITTTTTRMGETQIGTGAVCLRYNSSRDFLVRLRDTLAVHPRVHIVWEAESVEPGKVGGVPPSFIDELSAENLGTILYEADGARGLPFKAPAAHEPALAQATTKLVPVVGISALGQPLDDAHVHRAEIAANLAGARVGDIVTPLIIARVIAHPQGGLKSKHASARAMVLINQVETKTQIELARGLARLLLGYKEIDGVMIGAAQHSENPIRETHRRVAAVVMAAGAGTRMQGRIKQLLPWRGKTLIENAIRAATSSRVSETLVILGAHAETIRPVIRKMLIRLQLNSQWETGHASTIRAGIHALALSVDAAIFINADQPFLSSDVIDCILQKYAETDAPIVAPLYAGKRSSPVLFSRAHFDELVRLENEQGGRELLTKYRDQIQFVEFEDERLGWDIDTPEDYQRLDGIS